MSETATIGDNNPPDEFAIISDEINDLYDTAKDFLDGDPIINQGQADSVEKILVLTKDAAKRANELREYEVCPHNEAKNAIQAKYAPLIAKTKSTTGKTHLAIKACQDALLPWKKLLQEKKDEEARIASEEAESKQKEAVAALRASILEDREEAEKLIKEANASKAKAKRISKDNVKGMRTVWNVKVINPVELMRHYWITQPTTLGEYVKGLAEQDARSGIHTIPGCEITPDKVVK